MTRTSPRFSANAAEYGALPCGRQAVITGATPRFAVPWQIRFEHGIIFRLMWPVAAGSVVSTV